LRLQTGELSLSLVENALNFFKFGIYPRSIARKSSSKQSKWSSFYFICLPDAPVTERFGRFIAIPKVTLGRDLMAWKNGHLPKATMKWHWDAIACITPAPTKVNEKLNIVPDGNESERDMQIILPESRMNPNVEFNDGFQFITACRSVPLEDSFRALFARISHAFSRSDMPPENKLFMSHALYSLLDIGLRGKVFGDFEGRLFRAVPDGLKVVRTARLFRPGRLRFPDCAEGGRKREDSFVRVFSKSDMRSTEPHGLHLKGLLKLGVLSTCVR
jgi:hypothetical protein